MVLLEAWLAGTPAVVNGALGRCCTSTARASGGGLWFANAAEGFVEALALLLEDPDLRARRRGPRRGAEYAWPVVRRRLRLLGRGARAASSPRWRPGR